MRGRHICHSSDSRIGEQSKSYWLLAGPFSNTHTCARDSKLMHHDLSAKIIHSQEVEACTMW